MRFSKYHGLGNDYLVIPAADWSKEFSEAAIRMICHRHYGVGSDGILVGPLESTRADFGLRIFNPDGSAAEKSGNGLRIFARWLVDEGFSNRLAFTVETPGGVTTCTVRPDRGSVTVKMGKVYFDSALIPVIGNKREVLNEKLVIAGQDLIICAATVGNPHCVVLRQQPSADLARRLGPLIEHHPFFPKRTNVQFMEVLDRSAILIEIWERGAGYTLASGSSSTAAAAVARRLGLCDSKITVHMPGGEQQIQLDENYMATMSGPVRKVCTGEIAGELFDFLV